VVDSMLVNAIEAAGTDIIMSVPCNMIAGILDEIQRRQLKHIPVSREEEGVGIAAGAALAGKKPLLLMQNSGLGNSINAILSLTKLYRFPLFLMMSHRGSIGEKISAQIPMGQAVPVMLSSLGIKHKSITHPDGIADLEAFIGKAFTDCCLHAALLSRELWSEEI